MSEGKKYPLDMKDCAMNTAIMRRVLWREFKLRISPALVLFFLAPAIGELLSGSSPPVEFFNPFVLLLLSSLYGSGALIVRELKVRWNKGYVSMFILGAAYGIIEEGLMVKSFFDPDWMDLGILGVYGRWRDVNWVWAEWLTIYHATFSIAIPITLVELAFPDRRSESWIGSKKLAGLAVLLAAVTALGYSGLTAYKPPLLQYMLAFAVVVVLLFLAWRMPSNIGKRGRKGPLKPSRMALIGFLVATSLFFLFMAGAYIVPQPPVLMMIGMALVVGIFDFLRRLKWDAGTLCHKLALSAGAVSFLIVLSPTQEFDTSRLDNPRGMLIVGIVALALLILLRRRLRLYMAGEEAERRKLPPAMAEWISFCPNCGHKVTPEADYCPNCGKRLEPSHQQSGPQFFSKV